MAASAILSAHTHDCIVLWLVYIDETCMQMVCWYVIHWWRGMGPCARSRSPPTPREASPHLDAPPVRCAYFVALVPLVSCVETPQCVVERGVSSSVVIHKCFSICNDDVFVRAGVGGGACVVRDIDDVEEHVRCSPRGGARVRVEHDECAIRVVV